MKLVLLITVAAVYLLGLIVFAVLNAGGMGKSVAWWRVILWPLAIFGFGREDGP